MKNLLLVLLYLVAFVPAFALEGDKREINTKDKKEATLVEQAITKKCGTGESTCRSNEMEEYGLLLGHIVQANLNYHVQSTSIQQLLHTFKILTDQQKTDYLYARFVSASIAGCKNEAATNGNVLPSIVLGCVRKVEPLNRSDSIELRDQVDFKYNGRSDSF